MAKKKVKVKKVVSIHTKINKNLTEKKVIACVSNGEIILMANYGDKITKIWKALHPSIKLVPGIAFFKADKVR